MTIRELFVWLHLLEKTVCLTSKRILPAALKIFLFLGCYLTITYPKADGSQILRIYFTDFDQELEPVSSSRIEHFSGTEDLKDIAMFTAGDSGYCWIGKLPLNSLVMGGKFLLIPS